MTTPNLQLVPLSIDHLDGVMTWVNDPDVTFYFAQLSKTISRAEETAYLSQLIQSKSDIVYSIFEGEVYLGQIGISKIFWPARNGRIGITLARHAWGRGVASRAINLLLEEAFYTHKLHKLWVIIRSDNPKGIHMWTRQGFRCEGVLRDEYFVNDRFYDMIRFCCLLSDYESQQRNQG